MSGSSVCFTNQALCSREPEHRKDRSWSAFPPSESGPGPLLNVVLNNKSTGIKFVATNQQPIHGKILWRSSLQAVRVFFLKYT